jgi:hypothetical protein
MRMFIRLLAAVSWQLFARMPAQDRLPSEEDLLRDPALEDFGEAESASVIAQAKALYSHMWHAKRHRLE